MLREDGAETIKPTHLKESIRHKHQTQRSYFVDTCAAYPNDIKLKQFPKAKNRSPANIKLFNQILLVLLVFS